MSITFSISPNPHWVIIDNFDNLPDGAVIYTYSSLNKSLFKPAFQDAAGQIPYGQFIQGFENGTFPPIFWQFDSNNPTDTYYIRVYTAPVELNGVLLWDFDGLSGGGSGGGGVITTISDLQNLVINGQFYNNIGNLPIPPAISMPTFVTLAPSNHDGFCGLGTAPNNQPVGPDIIFAKSSQNETDSLTFNNFPVGSNVFNTTPTPQQYVRYVSNASGNSNYKFIQFPLVKGLQNLNGQNISVQMWCLNAGSTNIKFSLRQFFGNGSNGPSQDVVTDITFLNLINDNNWHQTQLNGFIVPSISSKTLGNCGNDALYLQIVFPASEAIDLSFILPGVYIGNITSSSDFHTLDYVDSIANTPRTGDTRTSLNAFAPYGWVQMNDGTIGNVNSNATARRNIDTFPLFDLIWRTFIGNQILAPMLTSGGSGTAYGATSWQDFSANNQIFLTRNLGRVMAGTLPTQTTIAFTSPIANTLTVASIGNLITAAPITISGSSAPTILANGTTYYVSIIPSTNNMTIYQTAIDALNLNNPILFGANAVTGNIVFSAHALGMFLGDETHLQAPNEVGIHNHPFSVPFSNQAASRGGGGADTVTSQSGFNGTTNINQANNAQQRMTIMQPTTYLNVFMKL